MSSARISTAWQPWDVPDAVYRDDGNIHYLEQRKKEITAEEGTGSRFVDEYGHWYLKACATEMPDVPDDAYYDGAQTDVALGKLTELENLDKPFFFGIGYSRPHLPFNVPDEGDNGMEAG